MNNKEQIEKLENALSNLENNKSVFYFLTYDTKGNARASIKHIYDMAATLRKNGMDAKILVEDKKYSGVITWLGDAYNDIPVVSIKEDDVKIKIEDVLVVPEYYSNVLEQLSNIKCVKVMLVQQKEYMFETLPIGSKWVDFGFDNVITTTEGAKKYIKNLFPEVSVYIIPPIIEDIFSPSNKPVKPFIAIHCRERSITRRLISEFYIKYPHLRWVTFKDMIQLQYNEFADALKECLVSVWVDDDSTFGTFPLESMKCGVPVVGKIPNTEPDWLGENGMWSFDLSKLVDLFGTYISAWLEGVELTDDVKQKMKETLIPYEKEITENTINVVFNTFKNNRLDAIKKALEKLNKQQEEVA